jgi:hypothetical protein
MKKEDRGLAIIFSHEFFDEIDGYSAEPRHGTVTDTEELSSTFSALGFKIDLQENRTYKQIMDHISQGTSVTTYLSYMTEKFVVLGISAFLVEKPGVTTEVSRVSPVFTCKFQYQQIFSSISSYSRHSCSFIYHELRG